MRFEGTDANERPKDTRANLRKKKEKKRIKVKEEKRYIKKKKGGVGKTRAMKVFMGKGEEKERERERGRKGEGEKGLAALDDSSTFDEKPARLCRHLGCW